MGMIKQVVLVRTDLGMSVGLLCAQVAHIHAGVLIDKIKTKEQPDEKMAQWLNEPYIFNHGLVNIEAFDHYYKAAMASPLAGSVKVWEDTIFASFYPGHKTSFRTKIGFSIGPADADAIKLIIGDLPLLSL